MAAEWNPHAHRSALSKPLAWLTAQSLRAPGVVVVGACLLALLAIFIAINALNFTWTRLDLLKPSGQYNQRWLAYLSEFGEREDTVIVVRGDDQRTVTATIDDLAAELSQQPRRFQSLYYRRDLTAVKSKGLHFVPLAQLERIEQSVRAALESLPRDKDMPNDPGAALAQLNERLERFIDPSPQMQDIVEREYGRIGNQLIATLLPEGSAAQATRSISQAGPIPSFTPLGPDGAVIVTSHASPAASRQEKEREPSFTFAQLHALEPRYLLAEEGRLGFMLLKLGPVENDSAGGARAIGKLRETIAGVGKKHPQVRIDLTGMPVIELDEMHASRADTLWTSLFAVAVVAALFIAGFGGLRHALLSLSVLLIGIAYSLGFITLAIGHLNILSAAFGVILIGLGSGCGVHYVASYLELRRLGSECGQALIQTAANVGPGAVVGGVATAIAFFSAGLTELAGLRELGIIVGGGILLCVLTTVTVLPALICLADWHRISEPVAMLPAGRWLRFSHRKPRFTLFFGIIAVALLAAGAMHSRYDDDLLNLQMRHVESVKIERELRTRLDTCVWCGISICDTREQLRQRKSQFEKLPSVAKTEEIVSLLPESTRAQQRVIASIYELLAQLPPEAPPVRPIDVGRLKREAVRAGHLLSESKPFVTPVSGTFDQLAKLLAHSSDSELQLRNRAQQEWLKNQVMPQLAILRQIAQPAPPALSDLPDPLSDRFVGKSHKHLLKVYARGDIADMQELAHFVSDLEAIDPLVTGHPVQTYYASRHVQRNFVCAAVLSFVAILGLLWLDFGSIASALLAMSPLAVGFALMCGASGWLGIPFHSANMIALPLVLGIGVNHGIHIVNSYRSQRGRFRLPNSTTLAVLLATTTTLAGFGSLILCRNQALQSIGQMLAIGMTCCFFSSVVVFPAILAWLSRDRLEPAADSPSEDSDDPDSLVIEGKPHDQILLLDENADREAIPRAQIAIDPLPIEPIDTTAVEPVDSAEPPHWLSAFPAPALAPVAPDPVPTEPRRRALPRRSELDDQSE